MSIVSYEAVVDCDIVNPDPHVITVWSDLGCPWASLALHTLRARARERQQSLLIDHRAFPLELFNTRPTPRGIVDAEIATLAEQRTELRWREWTAEDSAYPVTMLPAMEAVQACKAPEVGGLAASDQRDEALRHGFYVESQCIIMPSVILDIAASCDRVRRGRQRSPQRQEFHRGNLAIPMCRMRNALFVWRVRMMPISAYRFPKLAHAPTTHYPSAAGGWPQDISAIRRAPVKVNGTLPQLWRRGVTGRGQRHDRIVR
jgi:hypothetical protein